MSQAFADNGKADTHVSHRAGPAVSPGVSRERHLQPGHSPYRLQMVVHLMLHPLVLDAFRAVLFRDDGQQVRAVFGQVCVGVHDVLHDRFPADAQALSGLLAAVLQHTVLNITLFQVGQVHEGDTLQVDAQHEHIPCKGKDGVFRQAEPADGAYGFQGDGTFHSIGKAGEDVAENILVGGQSCLHRFPVQGAEGTQVAGRGVALHAPSFQPGFIAVHDLRVQHIDGHVLSVPETGETRQRVAVGPGSAFPSDTELAGNHAVYEAEPGLTGRKQAEGRGDVVGGVFQ